jgi:cation-transporting ATPase E
MTDATAVAASIDPDRGLTAAEVSERIRSGHVNLVPAAPSRTFGEILRANVFTRFNFLMTTLAVIIVALGSPRDALFFGVVISNTLIGTIQELRAKQSLDRLAVLSAPRAHVIRDGTDAEIGVEEIVLDDLLDLKPGNQVPADGRMLVVSNLEVDESLLTGEADPVVKQPGDDLLSGSFIVAGGGRAQVTKVGADAYAAQLADEARRFTLVSSELRTAVNRIITWVMYLVVPAAILLIFSQHHSQKDWREAAISAIGGIVAMVPEGLVLLTSVAFAVGVVRLARRRTLVQELPAIEVLARVDVVCLDKTGTITEGTMEVADVVAVGDGFPDLDAVIAAVAGFEPDPNATQKALLERYPDAPGWNVTGTVPFSSARKWSAVAFDEQGTWVLGAPEIVLADDFGGDVKADVDREADSGRRVLVLARTDATLDGDQRPHGLAAVALVLLVDRIRPDAPETLAYFAEQGVTLKVISGDNPRTVAAVAGRAGLENASALLDARQLPDDLDAMADAVANDTVFGRVTPHQKRAMVHALQSRGHVVAMTGDGVNDVLALKDADCGIAMASGSEATRAVAQLVLLDNSFAALPFVVAEGRRVINNIERVASLFLTKTVYAVLLALIVGVSLLPFPFLPRQLTLVGSITIGIPATILALLPNTELVRAGFLERVGRFAVPSGIVAATATMIGYVFARHNPGLDLAEERTMATLVLTGVSLLVVARVARPLDAVRLGVVLGMAGLILLVLVVPFGRDFFDLELPDGGELVMAAVLVALSAPALELGAWIAARVGRRPGADYPEPAALNP